MNRKITAVIFTAVFTLGISQGLYAEEQAETVVYYETAVSGAAVEADYAEEAEIVIEYLFEDENEAEIEYTFDDGAEAKTECVFEDEAFTKSEKTVITEKNTEKAESADITAMSDNFAAAYSLESDSAEEGYGTETAILISMEPAENTVNVHNIYSMPPKHRYEDETDSGDDEGAKEEDENIGFSDNEADKDNSADEDEKSPDTDNSVFEEEQADCSDDNRDLTEASSEDADHSKEGIPAAKKPSSRSGSSSSGGRKDYTESQTDTEASSEITEAEENMENNFSDNTVVYSGEELIKEADDGRDKIELKNGGAGLEIPSEFIEQSAIDADDKIFVSINRTPETVDVSVKINDEAVDEIEGAKIVLFDGNGITESYPADSLGEIYIRGGHDKALWPLGSAFPFVIAISYILLMGGAVAALWKKIKAQ